MKILLTIYLFVFQVNAILCGQHSNSPDQTLKRGIYQAYYEFKTNSPGITGSFIIDSVPRQAYRWTGTYSRSLRYSDHKREIKDVWGFCDGRNCYILFEDEFFLIQKDDEHLFFIGYGLPDMSNVKNGAIMGGMIGATATMNAARKNAKLNKHKYYIHPKSGYVFDSEFSMTYYGSEIEFAKIIFYRTDKGELPNKMCFYVSDSNAYSFFPNSYVELKLQVNYEPLEIHYGKSFSKNLKVYPDPDSPVYVKCSYAEPDSVYIIRKVESTTGKYESAKPKRKQQHRNKKGLKEE